MIERFNIMLHINKILIVCAVLALYCFIHGHCGLFCGRGASHCHRPYTTCYSSYYPPRPCHPNIIHSCNGYSCNSNYYNDSAEGEDDNANLEISNTTPYKIEIQDQEGNGIILAPNNQSVIAVAQGDEFTVTVCLDNNNRKSQTFKTQAASIKVYMDNKDRIRIAAQ